MNNILETWLLEPQTSTCSILIDAQKGVLTQTRRHSYLCHLLGIKHIVLAVNKMDLVSYDQTVFNSIISNYETFADTIGIKNFESIPISGLNGDNITTRSTNTKWYKGPTLLNHLEDLNIKPEKSESTIFNACAVGQSANQDFRGFSGRIASGIVKPGQKVRYFL